MGRNRENGREHGKESDGWKFDWSDLPIIMAGMLFCAIVAVVMSGSTPSAKCRKAWYKYKEANMIGKYDREELRDDYIHVFVDMGGKEELVSKEEYDACNCLEHKKETKKGK